MNNQHSIMKRVLIATLIIAAALIVLFNIGSIPIGFWNAYYSLLLLFSPAFFGFFALPLIELTEEEAEEYEEDQL
jgi:hypothetical protein|nr:MAG TPA: hypothetical protein [Caudoviricetes sp.]